MLKRSLTLAAILLLTIVATAGISLINLTSQVTGILPVVNGGTGQSTAVVPSGMIMFVGSGSCPTGWTEQNFSGNYILATVAANGDVGTSGGSNSYTPAGSVSAPTFTGNSVSTSAVSAGTPAGTNGTVTAAATGTKFSTSSSGTAALSAFNGTTVASGANTLTIPAETFTGSALGTHSHTVTATGTNSAPSFTGTGATLQPTYTKLIPCQKN